MRLLRLVLVACLLAVGAPIVLAPAAGAAGQAVIMQDYAFSPATLTVHAGDTVTWTNHDQAPHDVTTTSAPVAVKSPMLSTGQSFTYTFTTAGTYSYYCSIHPDMRAQVIVQPAAAAAPVASPAPGTTARPQAGASRAPATSRVQASPRQGQAPAAQQPAPSTSDSADPAVGQAPATAQPVVAAGTAPATSATVLDPMLLVAGVAAGVVVLCLLLLGSRRES